MQTRNLWQDLGTIPNLMCIYRIVSLPLLVVLFYTGNLTVVLALVLLASLTDFFDGILARRFNMATELGGLLDIVSDLLFTGIVLFIAVQQNVWPLYLFFVWMFRDISVLAMRWSAAQLHFSIPSIALGKIATYFIYLALITFFIDIIQPFKTIPAYNNHIHLAGLLFIHIGLTVQWIAALVYFHRYHYLYQTS